MPLYDLQCCACGHRHERFAHAAERPRLRCPECGGQVETDWSNARPPAAEKDWHGSKTRSIGLIITDEERDEVLAQCPAVEVNRAGQLISKNRSHHREQMKQLSAYERRQNEKNAPILEARRREREAAERELDNELRSAARDILKRRQQRQQRQHA